MPPVPPTKAKATSSHSRWGTGGIADLRFLRGIRSTVREKPRPALLSRGIHLGVGDTLAGSALSTESSIADWHLKGKPRSRLWLIAAVPTGAHPERKERSQTNHLSGTPFPLTEWFTTPPVPGPVTRRRATTTRQSGHPGGNFGSLLPCMY